MYQVFVRIDPNQITFLTDSYSIYMGIGQLVVLLFSALLIMKQLRDAKQNADDNYKWERKKATLDTNLCIMDSATWNGLNDFDIDIFATDLKYNDYMGAIDDKGQRERFRIAFDNKMNMLATVANNIKNEVLDADICFEDFHLVFIYFHEFSKDYIQELQQKEPKIWQDFVNIAEDWRKKAAANNTATASAAVPR